MTTLAQQGLSRPALRSRTRDRARRGPSASAGVMIRPMGANVPRAICRQASLARVSLPPSSVTGTPDLPRGSDAITSERSARKVVRRVAAQAVATASPFVRLAAGATDHPTRLASPGRARARHVWRPEVGLELRGRRDVRDRKRRAHGLPHLFREPRLRAIQQVKARARVSEWADAYPRTRRVDAVAEVQDVRGGIRASRFRMGPRASRSTPTRQG